MFDLSQVKKVGESSLVDDTTTTLSPEPTPEPTPEPSPEPAPDPSPEPSPEPTPPANDFPAERFGGKYKSWEDVESILNKEPETAPQYDDYLRQVIEKYQTDGTLDDYFKAYSVDYDSMSDQDMLKRNFFEQNKGLSDKAKERLWEKEISKYTIDPDEFSDDDIELGKELMKRDADKLRAEEKEKQKAFLSPKNESPKLDLQKLREQVEALPDVKKLKADKRISLSIDGQEVNYELTDPDFAVNSMVDDSGFYSLFTDNGRLNTQKWAATVEFAKNQERFLKTVLDQGRSLGRAEIESEMKNTKIPGSQPPSSLGTSDFKSGLLEAFAKQGKTTK
jgi:hypothetical protein